jgi:hypothetical protein
MSDDAKVKIAFVGLIAIFIIGMVVVAVWGAK